LAIAGGAAGCSIRVVLRNDTGILHVTFRDGADPNISQAVVYALPLDDMVRQPMIMSGWSPAYQGADVAPGRYLVLMLDHREELAYRDPEALRRYASSGQEVTVTANGKVDAEVSLIHGEP